MERFQLTCLEAARAPAVRTFVKHVCHRVRVRVEGGGARGAAEGQRGTERGSQRRVPSRSVP